jgi:hypothetical protein
MRSQSSADALCMSLFNHEDDARCPWLGPLVSFELPRRETVDVDVELVEPAAAILFELDLEFF